MGLLSKIWKGFKKVVKKIGKGIKKLFKKVGKFFGKMGMLGHIGMMFLMPYAASFWGSLGKFATRLAAGSNVAGKAFGHVMRGIYHAGKAAGTVYKGVTEAITGSLKWIGNKVGLTDFADPFSGFNTLKDDTSRWLSDGWKGTLEGQSFVMKDGEKLWYDQMTPEVQEAFKAADFKPKSLLESDAWKKAYPETTEVTTGTVENENVTEETAQTPDATDNIPREEVDTETVVTEEKSLKDKALEIYEDQKEQILEKGKEVPGEFVKNELLEAAGVREDPEFTTIYGGTVGQYYTSDGVQLESIIGPTGTNNDVRSEGYGYGGSHMDAQSAQVFSGFEDFHAYLNQRYTPFWVEPGVISEQAAPRMTRNYVPSNTFLG